ncbi:hypothetical protein BdWA1_000681 [Babesia duncani]|uniref:Uncharacterized protein n=1 Tax=Babesia duncani TaxID=323732 RepID=A0AAD9UQ09_9APIC|nr:hypothetical protein BdWA1_000681 [Babesia duncani]
MNRFLITKCIETLRIGFASDAARGNLPIFAKKQLDTVNRACRYLSRIDTLKCDPVINDNVLDRFWKSVADLLDVTKGLFASNRINSGVAFSREALSDACKNDIATRWNESLISYFLALVNFNIQSQLLLLQHLQFVDFSKCPPATVVAFIGGLHKSDLYKKEYFDKILEDCFDHLTRSNRTFKHLTARECSLLLWRRVSILYMRQCGLCRETQFNQIKTLIYNCFHSIKDAIIYKKAFDNPLFGILHSILDDVTRLNLDSINLGLVSLDNRKVDHDIIAIQQTLSNVSQAALVIDKMFLDGNCGILQAMSLTTIQRLYKIIKCSELVQNYNTTTCKSSDTHVKVSIATRDAIGDFYNIQQEHPVGNCSYTVDLLLNRP